jgi:uncharacterized membrane protein YdjX (TVP38/TMEM64 family)
MALALGASTTMLPQPIGDHRLKRYTIVTAGLIGALLLLFAVAEWLQVPLLTDPTGAVNAATPLTAALGAGLLIADVFLPVPSSILMTLHGALFGVLAGAAVSTVGALGAVAVGFALGRRGGPALARFVGPHEQARSSAMLLRWGTLAIIVSRPIPLLAESVAILAGASPLSWPRALVAGLAGSIPTALLYAWVGATARTATSGTLAFLLVISVATLAWLIGRYYPASAHRSPSQQPDALS